MSEQPNLVIPQKLTPLMQQYWAIKKKHADQILLFRMGDFYEMFYEDAKIAAPILNIALTSRNKKAEDDTPMCGVPHHSIAGPIGKLLAAGYRVAICDQLQDPEEAQGIVERGVTRILSPGMVYDPESLSHAQSNYVAAYDNHSVSFLESTTGECFFYRIHSPRKRNELLASLKPVELLVTTDEEVIDQSAYFFATKFTELEGTWPERFAAIPESSKRLLTYATRMQGAKVLAALKNFEERSFSETMALHGNVLKHLEVFQSYRGEERGSLFYAINRTKTSAGARMLKTWLRFPLVRQEKIEARLNRVETWVKKPADLKILRQTLAQMGDIERRLAKISYANCQVRDLLALMQSLRVGLALSPLCENISDFELKTAVVLVEQIEKTIVDDPPLNMKSGGYIRTGVRADLDELIVLAENSQKLLFDLEAREKEQTQISSLKVRYNSVFGYYIEVTNSHKDKVPDHYKRKQTLTNAERYVTQELHELEGKILSSRERRLQVEEKVFAGLRDKVLSQGAIILNLADKWSELDVVSSLAWLAIEQKYSRPTFSNDNHLALEGSRHPVVEQEVKKTFIPNQVQLRAGECLLLTGPNMAGKSTIMRQVAVTALLAQAGSFVPASRALLPIYHLIFTRIGASDSLSEGLSTFMVEMKETAEMLASANAQTLVVLDEVGRGTSTYDGMSLAQAILEHLVTKTQSTTLFATHYHELTQLADRHSKIHNAHMGVSERGEQIQFLYTLKSGPANKSYGIQVAQLAGLAPEVVQRARQLLKEHEARMQGLSSGRDGGETLLPLLAYAQEEQAPVADPAANAELERELELLRKIKSYQVFEKTPLEALHQISQWQQEIS